MNNVKIDLSQQISKVGFSAWLMGAAVMCLALIVAGVLPAFGQSTNVPVPENSQAQAGGLTTPDGSPEKWAGTDPSEEDRKHIGKHHDRLRAAKKREKPILVEERMDPYSQYVKLKDKFQKVTKIQYSAELAVMYQWGNPHAGFPVSQMLFVPSVNWDIFKNTKFGSLSAQFSYNLPSYLTRRTAALSQTKMNLITPINDFPSNNPNTFAQLSITYDLPHRWASVTVGQYPISNFDTNQYANTQWVNFISYPMAQNATQTYSDASLGTYVQINPTKRISLAGGFQDANNITGQRIQANTFGQGPWATFGYIQWNPKFKGLGSAQYSFLYYNWPAILKQAATSGWSFNAVQNLNDTFGLFFRANQANGNYVTAIKTSIATGVVINNPLKRNKLDQIGLGLAWDIPAKPPFNPPNAPDEWVMEAYWTWTFFRGMLQLSPDIQFYINPALQPGQGSAQVYTLRAVLYF